MEVQAKKMFSFCDIMVREFKHMNKLQKDTILYEIGFKDHIGEPLAHAGTGELYNEIISVCSQPSFTSTIKNAGSKPKRPRANSIHVFEPPKELRSKKPKEKEEGDPDSPAHVEDVDGDSQGSPSGMETASRASVFNYDLALENAW